MTIMQAPPGSSAGEQIKLLTGSTYTIAANLTINSTSQTDFIALQAMGFESTWPGGVNNLTAITDPVAASDQTLNYGPGSLWLNTSASPQRAWICLSAASGAAVWLQISAGTLITNAGSANFTNLTLTGLRTDSVATAVTAFNGGGQASATSLTSIINNVTTSVSSGIPFDSVKFSMSNVGQVQVVTNSSANPIQVFGTGSATVNGFAFGTGITLPAGQTFIGHLVATNDIQGLLLDMGLTTNCVYATNTATTSATLTGGNISGGITEVTLNLTGTLAGAANAQLPTVANLLAAIPNPVSGYSYRLRVVNSSSGAFAWTVTTNTGWTISGTMSIAQDTWRDFYITITSIASATATLQSVGTGTFS